MITEIMYNPPESGTDSLEFIELYNNGASPVDLNGYSMVGVNHVFAPQVVNPGEYVVIAVNPMAIQNTFGYSTSIAWMSGGLSNSGETVMLIDTAGNVVDSVRYDDAMPWPLAPDGLGSSLVMCDYSLDNSDGANWVASLDSTGVFIGGLELIGSPGAREACDTTMGPVPMTGNSTIIVSELMYNNFGFDAYEFLEFYNIGDVAVNLSGYSLVGVNFTFPDTLLFPAQYIVVALDTAAFDSMFGYKPFQWTSGALTNGGENVRLLSPSNDIVLDLFYDDGNGWPTLADGQGPSLVICNERGDVNNPGNWTTSETTFISGTDTVFASPGFGECLSDCGKDLFEPNENSLLSSALPLIGVNQNGKICDVFDEDWYWVEIGSDPNLKLTLSHLNADLDIEVFAPGDSIPIASSLRFDFMSEEIVMNNATPGSVYFIRVYSGNGSSSNVGYNLRAHMRSTPFPMPIRMPSKAIKTATSTPVSHLVQEYPIGLYPNPASDNVHVAFYAKASTTASITVRDLSGKLVLQHSADVTEGHQVIDMSLSTLHAGMYLVEIRNGSERIIKKLQVK